MQWQQYRIRRLRVPLLRPWTRDENGRSFRAMRLQVHQLLLRQMQDMQKSYENIRVQMNARIRRNLELKPDQAQVARIHVNCSRATL